MDVEELGRRFRERVGIRIGPQTGLYVLEKLNRPPEGTGAAIPVIGGDARTGAPIRTSVEPAALLRGEA